MNAFQVYLWLQVDSFMKGMVFLWIVFGIMLIPMMIYTFIENAGEDKQLNLRCAKVAITWLLFGTLGCFIPSSKTIAAMWVLPKIASNQNVEMVSEDGRKIYRMAIERVEDLLKPEEKPEDNH